jgi:hypothetical protein
MPVREWLRLNMLCCAVLLMGACACGAQPSHYAEQEAYLYRVQSCVAGQMPLEVNYIVDGNPPSLRRVALSLADVDSVIEKLDSVVAGIMKDAMLLAWGDSSADSLLAHGTSGQLQNLSTHFDDQMTDLASHRMSIYFCGQRDDVGGAFFSYLSDYFDRSFSRSGDINFDWLDGVKLRRSHFLMIVVALRLAEIDFDLDDLLATAKR